MSTNDVPLPREAIEELIAGGIEKYESRKGSSSHTGHPELGVILSGSLEEAQITRRTLAERCAVTPNYITKIISGDRMPTPKVLGRFHQVLGDQFLIDWFHQIEALDVAGQSINDAAYAKVVDPAGRTWVIPQRTFDNLVRRCVSSSMKLYGESSVSQCRKDMDALVRTDYEQHGVLLS